MDDIKFPRAEAQDLPHRGRHLAKSHNWTHDAAEQRQERDVCPAIKDERAKASAATLLAIGAYMLGGYNPSPMVERTPSSS